MVEKVIDNLSRGNQENLYNLLFLIDTEYQRINSADIVLQIPAVTDPDYEVNLSAVRQLESLRIIKKFKPLGFDYDKRTTICNIELGVNAFYEYFDYLKTKLGNRPSRKKNSGLARSNDQPFKNFDWESIFIKFIDGHYVKISAKGVVSVKVNYKDMGFEDARDLKPNDQWDLLRDLAENGGQLSWNSDKAGPAVKKQKERLAKTPPAPFCITK